jgi:imidazole glycerol-phosphate synthase subunit HisF
MLSQRLIGTVLISDNQTVQSIGFKKRLPLGKPEVTVEFLDQWGIDEILLLDMDGRDWASPQKLGMIRSCAQSCFVPLTVGGGIKSIGDVHAAFKNGADKVAICTEAQRNPELLSMVSDSYGNQAVIVQIDFRRVDNEFVVYVNGGKDNTGMSVLEFADLLSGFDFGEISLQSIDRDGMGNGLELDLIRKVKEVVSQPIIAMGGIGSHAHVHEGFSVASADAIAVGNMLHFTEHSVAKIKIALSRQGHEVRLDESFSYSENSFDERLRLERKKSAELERLKYVRHEPEFI